MRAHGNYILIVFYHADNFAKLIHVNGVLGFGSKFIYNPSETFNSYQFIKLKSAIHYLALYFCRSMKKSGGEIFQILRFVKMNTCFQIVSQYSFKLIINN